MQTILLVSDEPAHRFLYEHGLKKHFRLLTVPPGQPSPELVAAVIYDLGSDAARDHYATVASLGVPSVVLTPDPKHLVPAAEGQVVLEYPVSAQQVLQALSLLGVKA